MGLTQLLRPVLLIAAAFAVVVTLLVFYLAPVATRLVAHGMKPVLLPSHQFTGNTEASEQLERFYEAYRQSLRHLYE